MNSENSIKYMNNLIPEVVIFSDQANKTVYQLL